MTPNETSRLITVYRKQVARLQKELDAMPERYDTRGVMQRHVLMSSIRRYEGYIEQALEDSEVKV